MTVSYDALVEPDESSVTLSCGCKMWDGNDGAFAFKRCPMHDAAPDLLAAMENILNTRCFRNDLDPEHHAALDQCRTAIAKAKGQL